MVVTGWTNWYDSKYIDIEQELFEARMKALSVLPPIPEKCDLNKYSQQELDKWVAMREKEMEILLDCEEVRKIEKVSDEVFDAVKKDIKEHNYHFTGDKHQNAEWGTPIVDNKYKLCLSMKSWGDLIAQCYPDEIDDSNGMGYTRWAWSNFNGEQEYHPEKGSY